MAKAVFGKERFPESYQQRVGWNSRESLHNNSLELVSVLEHFNLPEDNMKVFEIGAGGGRNLKYIWDKNKKVKLYLNDLFEDASMNTMHESIKKIVTFYEVDTLTLFKKQIIDDIDLLISSDHLMHVEYESVEKILGRIRDRWKPKHILLREIKKEFETPHHPRLFHNYDTLNKSYDTIFEKTSDNAHEYFIKLYRRKND